MNEDKIERLKYALRKYAIRRHPTALFEECLMCSGWSLDGSPVKHNAGCVLYEETDD